ncbi:MAG: cupin domain-containing protein [Thermoguttaceae bacterium]
MDRRIFLKSAGAAAGLAALGGTVPAAEARRESKGKLMFDNAQFYGPDGNFDLEKAKDAVLALCKHHGYPVFPGLREGLWVSDYGAGQFASLGLAAYMVVNNVEDRYMMLEIFLLPGQMLPEHWHVDGEGNPAKREGWFVRWGASHIVGIGEPNLPAEIVIPKCHCDGTAETRHDTLATPGVFVPLAQVGSKHWQYGGPEGAILTEVANVHTNSAVRHADKKLNDFFLNAK